MIQDNMDNLTGHNVGSKLRGGRIVRKLFVLLLFSVITIAGTAWGASVHVTMRQVDSVGVGQIIGMIEFQDTAKGLKIWPRLRALTQGQHGIHVHQNPNCGTAAKDGKMVPGLAAGGHFDPTNAGRHEGPTGQAHLGDLPVLYVDVAGKASRNSWAPRLKTTDLAGRAIIIHAGGDNYSDNPKKLGGGGAGVACGVVGE
jgi:Cu-Zn family superoxide dismutase